MAEKEKIANKRELEELLNVVSNRRDKITVFISKLYKYRQAQFIMNAAKRSEIRSMCADIIKNTKIIDSNQKKIAKIEIKLRK